MKKFFNDLLYKMQVFMRGRYGYDEFSKFLFIVATVLIVISIIPIKGLKLCYILALLVMIYSCYRTFSKNIYKRSRERTHYIRISDTVKSRIKLAKNKWRDRKTHKYYTCPSCRATIRITKPPKGRTIGIRCPKCGNSFDVKT